MSGPVVVAKSSIRSISATFTRPNDTNGYVAGDVVNDSTSAPTVMTFPRATRGAGECSFVQMATLYSSANVATKLEGDLYLFSATVTPDNDNAAFTPTDAEMLTLIAVIAFPASSWVQGDRTSGAGGNAACNAQNLWIPIATSIADNQNAIFGVLVADGSYTPVAQEIFTVKLWLVE